MFLDNLKLTFAFFKFKVPNFKQFLWNIGAKYFLISAFLGEGKFICVHWFEILGEYSAAACTRSYSLGSKKSPEYHH